MTIYCYHNERMGKMIFPCFVGRGVFIGFEKANHNQKVIVISDSGKREKYSIYLTHDGKGVANSLHCLLK